ncbi:D-inositol-3-phosphate glycosyltransferase [Lipingzhangella sp. LS1_29]|uniref:D-inositol-3-phosphate glycosyltransferase n=1 Tax=Lipingzhangella rawalii TaxID=2055835 RepID=A0ABU2H5W0_9ACTN|nr:D-inositol-3-phosphate glycosyltransferase [Lipingzhangella rawalii]MDS1270240.1 D-inositol-3-phosphate glycosyltransferase [Lipingzhangella rawalii]
MLSMHTSPLEQPGSGDAGGMNVYVAEITKRLARRGAAVDVFTRATSLDQPPTVELAPGVDVHHIPAGPAGELDKNSLTRYLCPFIFGVLRTEAAGQPYDVVHGHYWLSGRAGVTVARRWGVPLVQSMHTLARVKDLARPAAGVSAEPEARLRGEAHLVRSADRIVANTPVEAEQLAQHYGADPSRVTIVPPGADLEVFTPGSRSAALAELGLPTDTLLLLFAGRIQRLKGPEVLIRAAAQLVHRHPELRNRLVVALVGGSSGEPAEPRRLLQLAAELGVRDLVRMDGPTSGTNLATYYRAATATVVPSHAESFGLVAVESQACGTPVLAARVGGLPLAVREGISGVLVDGHDPTDYASELARLVRDQAWWGRLAAGARQHAERLGWSATVDGLLDVYQSTLGTPAQSAPA